jgi:archaemetzincin
VIVALAAIGHLEKESVSHVGGTIGQSLELEVHYMPPLPDPAYAFDSARGQYNSATVLRELLRFTSNSGKLLGITARDLFIPVLSFVYGQAQVNGPAAIVSTARLRQEFYGLPPNPSLLRERLGKEALHELGHCFGLVHCPDRSCPMALATNIIQLDAKVSGLCAGCRALLQSGAWGSVA